MDQLHGWLEAQLAERRTEPNSWLGKAITYLLRHWHPVTLFLRQAGAPLDNHIVERTLKQAVLHRKNALFYRTLNGAQVGDLFMSPIHTCHLCGANSFDYLTELQRLAEELAAKPADYMPWNYRETLQRGSIMMNPDWPKGILFAKRREGIRANCGRFWRTTPRTGVYDHAEGRAMFLFFIP
jgi:hypothetical protein